jgi:AsmA protein
LPETDEQSKTKSEDGESSSAQALVVPLAVFKEFKANGEFKADYVVFNGARLEDIDVQVTSNANRLEVIPKASLYDGGLAGRLVYSEVGGEPQLNIKQSIDLVSLGSLLADAGITDQLSGIGTLDIDLTIFEKAGQQFNTGTVKLLAKNGALKGVDVKKVLDNARRQYDQLKGRDIADGDFDENDETRFAELLGTIEIDNFKLRNNDFSLKAPLFRVTGKGDIDVLNQNIDYLTKISVVNTSKGQGGEELEKLAGITLPVRFSGKLTAPKFSLDLKELYKVAAQRKVEERKAELVQEKLGIEGGEALSTKDILRAAAARKIDEKYGTGKTSEGTSKSDVDSATNKDQAADVSAEPRLSQQTKEPTEAEIKEQAKDQLKEDVKNLLLDGLFNR